MGRHFLSQLTTLSQRIPNISLVLISRTSKSLRASHRTTPLSLKTWETDLEASTSPALTINQTLQFLTELPSPRILVDNTSSQDVASAYPAFLQAGINIVTPNKKAFSGSLDLWTSIRESSSSYLSPSPHALIYHESSVGAGLPIISTLRDLIATGDTIRRIEGVFSGTLSYLFNNFAPLEPSKTNNVSKWSSEVQKAKEQGFTEPDPRDDLNGLDVARKLVILARLLNLDVSSPSSFPVQALIPADLESASSGEEFLSRLHEYDDTMDRIRDEAEREGKVVRYVGSVEVEVVEGKSNSSGKLKVGLEKLDQGHPIAGLKGSDNIVNFYTERYGENPLVVQGAG